jgi:hypothetical protein
VRFEGLEDEYEFTLLLATYTISGLFKRVEGVDSWELISLGSIPIEDQILIKRLIKEIRKQLNGA